MMTYDARCNTCGYEFGLGVGGTKFNAGLRCDTCGELILIDNGSHNRGRIEDYKTYYEKHYADMEKKAGYCSCGGKFKNDAPPRCPKCRSTDISEVEGGEVCSID